MQLTTGLGVRKFRFESLQIFRGLAAVAVVLFHAACFLREKIPNVHLAGLMPGSSGVDFFFVLSGFIISQAHVDDFGKPHLFGHYAYRRFTRIYPLYAICSIAVLILYVLHFGHFGKLRSEVLLQSFLLLPTRPGMKPILNPGWTLSYEALFYIIFGLLILAERKAARICLSILVTATLFNCFVVIRGPYFIHTWLLSPYNFEFLLGCFAAAIVERRVQWALPVGVCALLAAWILTTQYSLPLGDGAALHMFVFFGIPYFFIVLGAASAEIGRTLRLPRILISLGDATYSVYLTHFVVCSALASFLAYSTIPPALLVCLITAIATSFGVLVYRFVEKPLLALAKTPPSLLSSSVARRTITTATTSS
jgi:exopolysaccharide production protein ExoZ